MEDYSYILYMNWGTDPYELAPLSYANYQGWGRDGEGVARTFETCYLSVCQSLKVSRLFDCLLTIIQTSSTSIPVKYVYLSFWRSTKLM